MSIPPQIVAWDAARLGHFLLVVLCLTTLSANILAVGLGAVFNEAQVDIAYKAPSEPLLAAVFNESHFDLLRATRRERFQERSSSIDIMYVLMYNLTSGTPLPPWTTSDYFFLPRQLNIEAETDTRAVFYHLDKVRAFGARGNCTALPQADVPTEIPEVPGLNNETNACPDIVDAAKHSIRLNLGLPISRPSGPATIESSDSLSRPWLVDRCPLPLTLAFGRAKNGSNPKSEVKASFGVCRPAFETALFDVTVDSEGNILASKRVSDISAGLNDEKQGPFEQYLIDQVSDLFTSSLGWHNNTQTSTWLSHLTATLSGSRDFLDPGKPPPDMGEIITIVNEVYRKLYPLYLNANKGIFANHTSSGDRESDSNTSIRLVRETRVFLDSTAFIISVAVLGIQTLVGIFFYIRTRAFLLPSLPASIGTMLAYLAPSSLVWSHEDPKMRTFGFGWFEGRDGRMYLGIEADPNVRRIKPASLEGGDPMTETLLRRPHSPPQQP